MRQKISISPITRISGLMKIEIEIENHKVVDAKSSGLLYRGFEKILIERDPLDAVYFTERICGICSTAHSYVSTLALEDALKVNVDSNDIMLRGIIHGFEFIQNHIRHFYLYTIPDFVVTPDVQPVYSASNHDLRLPYYLNKEISDDYIEAVKMSMLAHQALAILGGKAPHNHGIFVGGVTEKLDSDSFIKLKYLTDKIKAFIENKMVKDADIISRYYSDYFSIGKGYGNLMSYGVYNNFNDKDIFYLNPQVLINGIRMPFNESYISESIYSSWYSGKEEEQYDYHGPDPTDLNKKNAYSFIKSPRYNKNAVEVGPLARMILSGEYPYRLSTMDRTLARVYEAKKIINIIEGLLARVKFNDLKDKNYSIFDNADGKGLMDTTRGSLAHFISIKDKKIQHYNIITPSTWNCSPKDENGIYGVIEKALIDTPVENLNEPVEIGRVVRSFDPCISCAVHTMSTNGSFHMIV